jgi:hypothetical protein
MDYPRVAAAGVAERETARSLIRGYDRSMRITLVHQHATWFHAS